MFNHYTLGIRGLYPKIFGSDVNANFAKNDQKSPTAICWPKWPQILTYRLYKSQNSPFSQNLLRFAAQTVSSRNTSRNAFPEYQCSAGRQLHCDKVQNNSTLSPSASTQHIGLNIFTCQPAVVSIPYNEPQADPSRISKFTVLTNSTFCIPGVP